MSTKRDMFTEAFKKVNSATQPPSHEEVQQLLAKALNRAFQIGQNYWAEADSESYAANRRSYATLGKFNTLRAETLAQVESLLADKVRLSGEITHANLPFADADPRVVVYRDEINNWYGYRGELLGDNAPFATWREAYRAGIGHLDYAEMKMKLAEKDERIAALENFIRDIEHFSDALTWRTDTLSKALLGHIKGASAALNPAGQCSGTATGRDHPPT
jgi:hypothetical protein